MADEQPQSLMSSHRVYKDVKYFSHELNVYCIFSYEDLDCQIHCHMKNLCGGSDMLFCIIDCPMLPT